MADMTNIQELIRDFNEVKDARGFTDKEERKNWLDYCEYFIKPSTIHQTLNALKRLEKLERVVEAYENADLIERDDAIVKLFHNGQSASIYKSEILRRLREIPRFNSAKGDSE